MERYMQDFVNYMENNNIKYTEQKENVLKVVYSGDNLDTISIFVIFDSDGDPVVQYKCWDIACFKNKIEEAMNVCNELNNEYRWIKFYVDEDGDIIAAMDAFIDVDDCGDMCMYYFRRMLGIVDDAFPKIAKARWA